MLRLGGCQGARNEGDLVLVIMLVSAVKSCGFPRKKVRRDWHHHSRALRRRLMGQGGIAGC